MSSPAALLTALLACKCHRLPLSPVDSLMLKRTSLSEMAAQELPAVGFLSSGSHRHAFSCNPLCDSLTYHSVYSLSMLTTLS
jgi:hypothetical protein